MLTVKAALALVDEHLGQTSRARHSVFVGVVMRHLADARTMDQTLWEVVGLSHDLDFEITRDRPGQHGLLTAQWLAGQLPEQALQAIRAHDHRTGITSDTPMANALKLADALAVISETLADQTIPMLRDPDASALLTTTFANRPYLPAMLLDHSRHLGMTLSSLAEICVRAPSPC